MIYAKIVVDSSANMAGSHLVSSVPLKIITDEKEYIDDEALNTSAMVWDLNLHRQILHRLSLPSGLAGSLWRCPLCILHRHHQQPVRQLQRSGHCQK